MLLARAGRQSEAGPAFERAIGLETDPAVRRFLQERQAESGEAGAVAPVEAHSAGPIPG